MLLNDMNNIIDNITNSKRLRRLRQFKWSRALVQETNLKVEDLILPIFLCEGKNQIIPIESLPGVYCYSVDKAIEVSLLAESLGIVAVAPFARELAKNKDRTGSYINNPDNLTLTFTRGLKAKSQNIGIIVDVALDPYTDHGHDGILQNGIILNDETVEVIAKASVLAAQSGADIISPSDMMDGRIGAIRQALNAAKFQNTAILSYTAKYASSFYGPYRDAIGTKNLLKGDKKTYYISPANKLEALREAELDIAEGADLLMVKPGMPYLDIISNLNEKFNIPIFAYQVSGEYAMIKAAAQHGWIDEKNIMMESLLAFKRAGCTGILSYFAIEAAKLLKDGWDIA